MDENLKSAMRVMSASPESKTIVASKQNLKEGTQHKVRKATHSGPWKRGEHLKQTIKLENRTRALTGFRLGVHHRNPADALDPSN